MQNDNDLPITGFQGNDFDRAPLMGAHQNAPSHAFSINIAINPLIAAAAPLFTLATHLREQTTQPNLTQLHADLSYEIHAFESRAHNLGYRSQLILAARYLLCAMLDEFILNTQWGKNSDWQNHNLLMTFQRENWGGERFFLILERCSEDPAVYLDILELGYLCLSLGYLGKYQEGHQRRELAAFIDHLYQVIRRQRGEVGRFTLANPASNKAKKISRWRAPPLWLTGVITLIILIGVFTPYYLHLKKLTHNAQQNLHNLMPTD